MFHCTLLLPIVHAKIGKDNCSYSLLKMGSGLIQSVGDHTLLLQEELLYYHRSTAKLMLSQCKFCTDFKVFCSGASDEVSVLLQILSYRYCQN